MRNVAFAALLVLLATGAANARETGVINQAGPYESTMQFYLHPAQGFAGSPEPTQLAEESDKGNGEAKQPVRQAANRPYQTFGRHTRYASDGQKPAK